ncbi:MAG: hypothetical protein E7019_05105 [Alphaproteobacteria bacterium]|nr:hypothetical protein [Alphaproteobacteria bacterium]
MKRFLLALFAFGITISVANAQENQDGAETGLPIPRFVSLRSNHINARSGPGSRYPIDWVYMQKSAPVEIIAEFELYRKIRDWQGSESWVHKSMLSGKRFVKVVTPGENNIYAKDDYKAKVIAKVEDEVVGEIKKCPAKSNFCLVQFDKIDGWLPRQDLYGIYADEIVD